MSTSLDDASNFPHDTSKKHQHFTERQEVERHENQMLPLGEYAVPHAVGELSPSAEGKSGNLLHYCNGRKMCAANKGQGSMEEGAQIDNYKNAREDIYHSPVYIHSVNTRLDMPGVQERVICDTAAVGLSTYREEDYPCDSSVNGDTKLHHQIKNINTCWAGVKSFHEADSNPCNHPSFESNGVDEHDNKDVASLEKETTPDDATNSKGKHSMDGASFLQPQDPSNREKTFRIGFKLLLESVRANSSLSRGGAMKARVSSVVRRFLSLGSDAQILPLITSYPDAENRNCSQQLQEQKKRVMEQSPNPWLRKRSARGEGSPEKDSQAFFNGTGFNIGVGTKDSARKTGRTCRQDNLINTRTASSSQALRAPGCVRIYPNGEVEECALVIEDISKGDRQNVDVGGAGVLTQGKRDGIYFDAPGSREFDASAPGGGVASRIKEGDLRVTPRGEWPDPLDKEPVAADWALDSSEEKVLAVAKRIGSVLVRVVTWNLHAKPMPGAEKLREALLPPGKFHIYAIGTQECQNSIAKSMIVHSKKEWEDLLKETLGPSYEMLCGHALQATHNAVFAHRGLIPLLRGIRSSAVATGLSLGTPGTNLGNKGGVGISFALGSTCCIFVNSHLAAHQSNVRERNDNFFQISKGLVHALGPRSSETSLHTTVATELDIGVTADKTTLTNDYEGQSDDGIDIDTTPTVRPGSLIPETIHKGGGSCLEVNHGGVEDSPLGAAKVKGKPSLLGSKPLVPQSLLNEMRRRPGKELAAAEKMDGDISVPPCMESNPKYSLPKTLPDVFDRVVWAGDLNYRVNVSRTTADMLLSHDLHEVLLKNEQLVRERERTDSSAPFVGYREGPLNFRPTYKFDSDSDRYDSSSKQRVPAWTDRVLFAGSISRSSENGKKNNVSVTAAAGKSSGRMHLTAYHSVTELRTSDHRPVVASFVMEFDQREKEDSGKSEEEAITNQTSSEICTIM